MILYFDTETTGIYNNKLSCTDERQPWCVELAYIFEDEKESREIVSGSSFIINNNIEIPESASKIHGITTKIAKEKGFDGKFCVESFISVVNKCEKIVGHNVKFDLSIMKTMAYRYDLFKEYTDAIDGKEIICTMALSKNVCRLDLTEKQKACGMTGYKQPKLIEAYEHFFDSKFHNAHSALADVRATKSIYKRLIKIKKIENAAIDGQKSGYDCGYHQTQKEYSHVDLLMMEMLMFNSYESKPKMWGFIDEKHANDYWQIYFPAFRDAYYSGILEYKTEALKDKTGD